MEQQLEALILGVDKVSQVQGPRAFLIVTPLPTMGRRPATVEGMSPRPLEHQQRAPAPKGKKAKPGYTNC